MTSSGPNPYSLRVNPTATLLLALQSDLLPAPGQPVAARSDDSELRLNISVVFTSEELTRAALGHAAALAESLDAKITLLAVQSVPFPLQLQQSPVSVRWNEERALDIAADSPVETAVQVYLCRDRLQTLRSVLESGSIVVIGCRRRPWPTFEMRLGRKLRHLGYEVVLTEGE